MNRLEWHRNQDAGRMLGSKKAWGWVTPTFRPSDRKLRLLCCAVARGLERETFWYRGWRADGQPHVEDEIKGRPSMIVQSLLPPGYKRDNAADALRDIVGDPFRPVRLLWELDRGGDEKWRQWLTEEVKSVAVAAYQERHRQETCRSCSGEGCSGNIGFLDDPGERCDGGGKRWVDGTLDPVRLAVLADALTDTGCTVVEVLNHLRGLVVCPQCGGEGKVDSQVDAGYDNALMATSGWRWCHLCNEGGRGDNVGWLRQREPARHYPGCWVVDLLLGKE